MFACNDFATRNMWCESMRKITKSFMSSAEERAIFVTVGGGGGITSIINIITTIGEKKGEENDKIVGLDSGKKM